MTDIVSGLGLVERYHDSGLVLPEYVDRKTITTQEVDRIQRAFVIVALVSAIPRRLGNDVSKDELALDKRRARRVAHALIQSSRGWQMAEPKLRTDEDARIAAMHLDWEAFGPAHMTTVQARLRFVATYAYAANDIKWGRSALIRLENEINWVSYALRG